MVRIRSGSSGSTTLDKARQKAKQVSTVVNVDKQSLGTTSIGTATSPSDKDSNAVDTGNTDPGITVVESGGGDNNRIVPPGTDNDTNDGSSPGGGSGEQKAEHRAKQKGMLPDKKGISEKHDGDADTGKKRPDPMNNGVGKSSGVSLFDKLPGEDWLQNLADSLPFDGKGAAVAVVALVGLGSFGVLNDG